MLECGDSRLFSRLGWLNEQPAFQYWEVNMEPVTEIAISSRRADLNGLARALRLRKGKAWRPLKGERDRYRLRCRQCGSAAHETINEPVARKRHTRTAHKRRTITRCLICKTTVMVTYGG